MAKGALAQEIIARAAPRGVLAVQALLEFLAVVGRRRTESLPGAMAKVEAWSQVFGRRRPPSPSPGRRPRSSARTASRSGTR